MAWLAGGAPEKNLRYLARGDRVVRNSPRAGQSVAHGRRISKFRGQHGPTWVRLTNPDFIKVAESVN
jgi:hypothetical protein